MSKTEDSLDGMERRGLTKLIERAEKALKYLRPFRVKLVFKKCGKKGCSCEGATSHGPYTYVVYTDRQGGPRQRSLGKTLTAADLDILDAAKEPQWYDFSVPDFLFSGEAPIEAKAREADSRSAAIHFLYLSSLEYLAYYGIREEYDTLNRPHRLAYDRIMFQAEWDHWQEGQKIAGSEWAEFGVGTSKGIGILNTLSSEGYYFER